jgi:formate-dependent nitrite reductase membrane component NrfD
VKNPITEYLERMQDGRNVDPRVATLEGEAAGQQVTSLERANPVASFPLPVLAASRLTEGLEAPQASPTYYELPVVKGPVWIWSVPTYFFVGGVSGISSTLASVVRLVGDDSMRSLVRDARWTGAVGDALSAGLLIHDLGRPSRFLNMLRVFRPTSPMSVGSWVLSLSGGVNAAAAVFGHRGQRFTNAADFAGLVGGALGLPLAGYTAVLVGNSAVPVWKATRHTLPFLFLTSASAAAASFLELLPRTDSERRVLRIFGTAAKVADAVAHTVVEQDASRAERVGRPLKEGVSGALWRASQVMNLASLGLSLAPGKAKWKREVAAGLSLASSFALRWSVFQAGKRSARDPRATFEPQRKEASPHASLADSPEPALEQG